MAIVEAMITLDQSAIPGTAITVVVEAMITMDQAVFRAQTQVTRQHAPILQVGPDFMC